jgi:hypothetical protein
MPLGLFLILNGNGRRTVVSVMPQGLYRAAVAAGTESAWASYDVDAATMHLERHERGIHALCPGAAGAGVTKVRFRFPASAGARHERTKINLD